MQLMPGRVTVEEIIPLVEALSPRELARLLRLIAISRKDDSLVYESIPPGRDEFLMGEDPLAWDSDGWENVS